MRLLFLDVLVEPQFANGQFVKFVLIDPEAAFDELNGLLRKQTMPWRSISNTWPRGPHEQDYTAENRSGYRQPDL